MKRVVLVRTIGPRNVGSAMRAAANFGVDELLLVAPARPSVLVHPEFEQMSHGVQDLRERIRVVDTLDQALVDTTRSIGFTARARGQRKRLDWRSAASEWCALADDPLERVALVFGSEENGLTIEETDRIGVLASLPTAPEHTSLNLALAVGVVLYTLYGGKGVHVREKGPVLAERQSTDFLKARLKQVLCRRTLSLQASADLEASIERVFTRAPIESRDARAWHKLLEALDGDSSPARLGVAPTERAARRRRALDAHRAKAPPTDPTPPPD